MWVRWMRFDVGLEYCRFYSRQRKERVRMSTGDHETLGYGILSTRYRQVAR
jgi:hypothetical protein